MDSHIRNLLSAVDKGDNVQENLLYALELLKQTKPNVSGDISEPFSSDLYVIYAEKAFEHGATSSAADMLKIFLSRSPPSNQFLCRAYLCHAQLIAPKSSDQFEEFEKSVVYLLKAISFAKENSRYYFLVYNASVLYWNFCRSFLKPGTKQYLTKSMQQVVKALDDIDDSDYEWRATLMIALVQCHLDGGRIAEASTVAGHALTFIRSNFPAKFKELFGIVIKNNLVDVGKLTKDMKHSPELTIYYRLCKLKSAIETHDNSLNLSDEIQKILKTLVQGEVNLDIPENLLPSSGKKGKARPQTPNREKEDSSGAPKSPVKTKRTAAAATPVVPPLRKLPIESTDKSYLLLDLARIGLELNLAHVVAICVDQMRTNCVIKDKGFLLEVEFLEAMLSVKLVEGDLYSSENVQKRLHAIMKCEEAVLNAVRHGDPKIIQVGCITLWNLGLPLLQKNLRKNLRKPLQVIALALEDIKSLLMVLRCQIHLELGKCEEDVEQIEVALQNYKKALLLDDTGMYSERLEMAINRVELRATLYDQPERAEDIATMIIEQAQASDSGSIRMKRSLLIKVGLALAPDVFDIALDSENEAKATINAEKTQEGMIKQMNARAQQYQKCIAKVPGHLERLGAENDLERAHLWSDLAKIARKQQVWDVCRVACKFCLLYDDNRWRVRSAVKTSRTKTATQKEDPSTVPEKTGVDSPANQKEQVISNLLETDTMRMLAEVHFINAEALIHLLRTEEVELNDEPVPPQDTSKKPKGYVPKKPEDMPDWVAYRTWVMDINQQAVNSFLRATAIGKELGETWIVVNAATYFWNYNNHMVTQSKHREIYGQLQVILDGLKKAGHEGATTLLVHICVALAQGYIQPWLPPKRPKEPLHPRGRENDEDDEVPAAVKSPKGKKVPANVAAAKAKIPEVTISPDAQPDLKKALEVIEYAMKVTNGSNPVDLVPVGVRYPMLQMWVLIKQLLQQQIGKSLGAASPDDEDKVVSRRYAVAHIYGSANEGQNPMTRAQVAVDMLCLSVNGIFEFKEGPTLEEAATMTENCDWTDSLIELQLWTRLAAYARFVHDHQIVLKCTEKALNFTDSAAKSHKPVGSKTAAKTQMSDRWITEQKLFAYASCMRGETLIENMRGQNSLRHEAIHNFLQSAQSGRNAKKYSLVLSSARNYWNAVLPLIGSPFERQLLKESLKTILECLAATMDKNMMKEREEAERLQKAEEDEQPLAESPVPAASSEAGVGDTTALASSNKPYNESEDDLALQAAMYGVLFQVYADNQDWQEGLKLMDTAITSMPRTKHRLLLFKHRVMVKAKLGHNVSLDIQKFRNESEAQFSAMWHKLALFSKESGDQLTCYQNAIEALMKTEGVYQRVDYLIEYAQWLKVNDFPLDDTLDILEWASDLLLNMRTAADSRPGTKGDKRGAKKGQKGAIAPAAPKKKKEEPKKGKEEKKDEKTTDKKEDKKAEKDDKKGAKKGTKTPESKRDGAASKASSRQKSVKKEDDSEALEINEEDYIPVEKKAVIGLKIEAEDLKITDLTDMKQLEYLSRISVMAASIAGQGHSDYTNYCFTAYGYIHRMWQLLLSTVGPAIKEIAKQAAAAAESGKSAKKGKGKEKEAAAPTKERPKRKGPVDHLPQSVEEWSAYDAPEEVVGASGNALLRRAAVNDSTITKPSLLLYLLDKLVTMLRSCGYNHLCLPVLAFEDLLTRSLAKSHAYNILIHLQSIEVCLELNLLDGVKFHEKLVNQIVPVEVDLASSYISMAVFKEKQYQVEQEEKRIQDSLKEFLDAEKVANDGTLPAQLATPKKEEESNSTPHLGQKLSSVNLRQIWTNTARVLIRLGLNQAARQYLYAAHTSAKEFDESTLQGEILYLLAQLAYKESQYAQAIKMILESHSLIGSADETYWYETCSLISDCQREDTSLRMHMQKASNTCVDSLNMLKEAFQKRPVEISTNGYIMGMLEAKLAKTRVLMHMEHFKVILKPRYLKAITNSLDKWKEAGDKLLEYQCHREAVEVYRDVSLTWSKIATQAHDDASMKHELLIKAYNIIREACEVSGELNFAAMSSMLACDLPKVSLPVQREYVDTQLTLAGILLQILECHVDEEKAAHDHEKTKGHVQKVVEEAIRQTPVFNESEMSWRNLTMSVAQMILSVITGCFHLCSGIPLLKTEALYCGGKCLRLLSLHTNMDSPNRWTVNAEMVAQLLKTLMASAEETEDSPEDSKEEADQLDTESKDYQRIATEMAQVNENESEALAQLAQATELLGQGLQLSLSYSLVEKAKLLSYELVEVFAQFDTGSSSQYLALYQSCCASSDLKALLDATYKDPMASRKAALVRLHDQMMEKSITTNLVAGQLFTDVCNILQEGQAWQKLSILQNHLELVKELPANWQIVVLQHSPCRHYLYGAVLDRPESVAKKTDKSKPTGPIPFSKAKIQRVKVDPSQLDDIIEAMRDHRFEVMTTLLKQEYQRTIVKQQERMLESIGEVAQPLDDLNEEEDESELQGQFDKILTDLEEYMKPLTDLLDIDIRPPTASSYAEGKKEKAGAVEVADTVVLLADCQLLELPLEALTMFESHNISSMTRDLSLQMIYHRHHQEQLTPEELKAAQQARNAIPSRIPGARDAAKKQAKYIPLDRPIPTGYLPVDTNNVKFMVDPHGDLVEDDDDSPMKIFDSLYNKYNQQFTTRWIGITHLDHEPSVCEWETYLTDSSSFFFYGFEHLLSYLSPDKLVSLDIPECMMCLLYDSCQTGKSFTRRSINNVLKQQSQLSLETPLCTALMLSLAGVKCVVANQWHCTLPENSVNVKHTFHDLLERGRTTGVSGRLLCNPAMRQAIADAEREELEREQREKELKTTADKPEEVAEPVDDESASVAADVELPEEKEEPEVMKKRQWYNMVTYGLPNLIVTQL